MKLSTEVDIMHERDIEYLIVTGWLSEFMTDTSAQVLDRVETLKFNATKKL